MPAVTKLIVTTDAAANARADLAAAMRIAALWGINEGVNNHFTMRVPGTDDRFLMNPGDIHWSEVRASDVLTVDQNGQVVEGSGQPVGTAPKIHIPMHQRHPRGGCVFHTHMPWASALCSIQQGRLEMCHQNALRFYQDVAYDDDFNGLAMESDEGGRMAAACGNKSILFLANHGVVSVAETIEQTLDNLYYLDRACQIQVLAMSTGRPLLIPSETMCRKTKAEFNQVMRSGSVRHFSAMKRILDSNEPEYRT
ncbi:MAG: aldolase [Proteobacteria bacterium]|nr:aldolase [Pseudomonadota bacterium]